MKQQTLTGNTIEIDTDEPTTDNRQDFWTYEACTVAPAQLDYSGHTERDLDGDSPRLEAIYTYTLDGDKYAGESIDTIYHNDEPTELIIVPITNEDGTPYYADGEYHRITIEENTVKQLVCDDRDAYTVY